MAEEDWDAVKSFLDEHENALTARINVTGRTILHVSVANGKAKIVEELVNLLSREELEIQDIEGRTAFSLVALFGFTKLAECMVRKNENLVCMADIYGRIPVVWASENARGYNDTVRYLYSVTPLEILTPERGSHGASLMCNCILANMFGKTIEICLLLQYF